MCGRYKLIVQLRILREMFGLADADLQLTPRWNIAPSQDVPVIPNVEPRHIEFHRWGLIPHWAKDMAIGYKLINARAETLAEKPSFREALKKRRCLILADGFYEWRADGKSKTPIHISPESGLPFAFAGLWETWKKPDGTELRSCTIITTAANRLIKVVHDRMPVILPASAWDQWLDPAPADPAKLAPLLGTWEFPLRLIPISTRINDPKRDGPECLEPLKN